MTVFREKKKNNFVIMSNYHLRDKNLSEFLAYKKNNKIKKMTKMIFVKT